MDSQSIWTWGLGRVKVLVPQSQSLGSEAGEDSRSPRNGSFLPRPCTAMPSRTPQRRGCSGPGRRRNVKPQPPCTRGCGCVRTATAETRPPSALGSLAERRGPSLLRISREHLSRRARLSLTERLPRPSPQRSSLRTLRRGSRVSPTVRLRTATAARGRRGRVAARRLLLSLCRRVPSGAAGLQRWDTGAALRAAEPVTEPRTLHWF